MTTNQSIRTPIPNKSARLLLVGVCMTLVVLYHGAAQCFKMASSYTDPDTLSCTGPNDDSCVYYTYNGWYVFCRSTLYEVRCLPDATVVPNPWMEIQAHAWRGYCDDGQCSFDVIVADDPWPTTVNFKATYAGCY